MFPEVDNMQKSTFDCAIIAGIHIGRNYSACGYSSKSDWRKAFSNVWIDSILYQTGITCLLLKKDLSESLFGYEAVDKYSELTYENRQHEYFFF